MLFGINGGYFPAICRVCFIMHCFSLPLASARCFHFSIYPNKTEYFNMTVWGVSGPTGLGRVNNDDKSATASSATSSHFHFPLANLSLPIGHVIKLCSSTNSSLSCSKYADLNFVGKVGLLNVPIIRSDFSIGFCKWLSKTFPGNFLIA